MLATSPPLPQVRTAHKVQASLVVVLTRGGATARLVAKYRPTGGCPVGVVAAHAGLPRWLPPPLPQPLPPHLQGCASQPTLPQQPPPHLQTRLCLAAK